MTPSSRLKGNRNRPGSIPTQGWSKSADIDVSLLKDIADLLEKVTAVPDFMAQGKGQAPKSPKTDSPSVPEPATPSPSPTPETPAATTERKSSFTGWESATPGGDVAVTSAKVTPPTTPTTPTSTPDTTPDTPAATGGKMKGAGKRVGAGVKDFGTGFGEGFSGGTSDGGSGSGVNINIGGGGGSTTASGGGGGTSAPADTSADDDAGVRASQEATGPDYSQGESTTGPSATPPEKSKEDAGVDLSSLGLDEGVIEELKNEMGWSDEQIVEIMKTPDKPSTKEKLAQVGKGAKKAIKDAGTRAILSTTSEGRAANQRIKAQNTRRKDRKKEANKVFASDDRLSDYPQFEKSEELVKSWNYSG